MAHRAEQAVQVLVNGEPQEIPAGSTVETLVEVLGLERRRVAVAVNRSVVPRSSFRFHVVQAGDRIEILEAVGGG